MAKTQPFTFHTKLVLAAMLVLLADRLLYMTDWGWVLAAFCAAWVTACAIAEPAVRRHPWSLAALTLAAVMAALQAERPSLVGMVLFWLTLSAAVLAPRAERFQDIRRWLLAAAAHGFVSIGGPAIDLAKIRRLRRKGRRESWLGLGAKLLLPLAGGLLFLGMFTLANPVISTALARIDGPPIGLDLVVRVLFWALVLVAVWATLRPRWFRLKPAVPAGPPMAPPGVTPSSVTSSLIVFNGLFALQNALDLAFLWSGARLPEGLTYAEYAHRGVYALIATAMLAGLFVLIALRPGSETARRPLVRALLVAWIGQNVFLMASSALRLARYVEAYSLSQARIWAFAVIALVAVGLALICWRMLRGKSSAWLVNANAAALAAAVAATAVVDTGAVSAEWNVRHAREAGGQGQPIDLCYLHRLGVSAVVPLSELQQLPLQPETADRVAWVRSRALLQLQHDQNRWSGWTWRGARRLEAIGRLAGGRIEPYVETSEVRECDGRRVGPPGTASAPHTSGSFTSQALQPASDLEKEPVR